MRSRIVESHIKSIVGGSDVRVANWVEARAVFDALLRTFVAPTSAGLQANASGRIAEHNRRLADFRSAAQRLLVPRRFSDMASSPLREGGGGAPTLDEEELEGWIEQSFPLVEQADPSWIALPNLVANLDSLGVFKIGMPTGVEHCPMVHPLHHAAGTRLPASALQRDLDYSITTSREAFGRYRALASAEPMHLSSAIRSIKSAVIGAADCGMTASTLANRELSCTLLLDANTQALLSTEDTFRLLVQDGRLRRANLRLRTAPFDTFPPRTEARFAALKGRGLVGPPADDTVDDDFDLVLWSPPGHPLVLQPTVSSALHAHRYGAASKAAARRFDGFATTRLRATGGFIGLVMTNTASLALEGTDAFGDPERSVDRICADWTPNISGAASEVVYQRVRDFPDQLAQDLRFDFALHRQRCLMLGERPPAEWRDDPFTAAAATPPDVAEALQQLSETRARGLVAIYRVDAMTAEAVRAAALGRDPAGTSTSALRGSQKPATLAFDALKVVGQGTAATQGPTEFRDTYEYEAFLPKDGPPNPWHWTEVMPTFEFLDEDAVAERRRAARRVAEQRRRGQRVEWPRNAEGVPLMPHRNRGEVIMPPKPAVGAAAVHGAFNDPDAKVVAAQDAARLVTSLNDAASPLRHEAASMAAEMASGTPSRSQPSLVPHLFSAESRAARRKTIRKKVLSSVAATEHYIDGTLLPSAAAQLSLLNELNRRARPRQ